jgi:hypothetical protein
MNALVNRLVTGPGSGLYHPQIWLQVSGRTGMSVRMTWSGRSSSRRRSAVPSAATVEAAGVGHDDNPDPGVGCDGHLGQEPGDDAVMTDGAVTVLFA